MPKITAINGAPEGPWGQDNDMMTWEVMLDDGGPCVIFRKVGSPDLQAGQEIEITGQTKPGRNGEPPKRKGKVPGQGGGRGGSYDLAREQRITRQHSQQMALRCAIATGKPLATSDDLQKLVPMIDWFDNDAFSRTGKPGATPPQAPPTPVAPNQPAWTEQPSPADPGEIPF